MSFINNLKVIQEFDPDKLEKRRKYTVIKFWNAARSREPEYIFSKNFENYNSNTGLKKSSVNEIDKDIRATLGLEHNKFFIYQEIIFNLFSIPFDYKSCNKSSGAIPEEGTG